MIFYFVILQNIGFQLNFVFETLFIICLITIIVIDRDKIDIVDIIPLLLILLTLPSMSKSPDKYKNFLSIKNLFFSFSCLLFFRNFCSCSKKRSGFFHIFSLYILYLSLTVNWIFISRIMEFGLSYAAKINFYETPYHINFLGAILNLGLFFLAWIIAKPASRTKMAFLILAYFSITASIFLTLSKIAFFLLVLNLCFMLKYSFKVKMKYIFICILLIFCVMLMHTEIRNRFSNLIFGKYYLDRLRLLNDGLNVISMSPIVGVGGLNFGFYNRMLKQNNIFLKISRNGTYAHCHNTILELLLSYGFIFFIFFLIFLYFLFSKGYSDEANRPYFIFFLILVGLNSIVDNYLWMTGGYILLALFGGLCWKKGTIIPSRIFRIGFMILFILGSVVFIRYNYFHTEVQKIFSEVNKSSNLDNKIKLLENATQILPFSSDIYRYLGVFNIFRGFTSKGFEAFQKAIKYSRFDLELSLFRIWHYAVNKKPYQNCIKICQSLSPDEDGFAEITYALVCFYTGNTDEAKQYFANYLIKFPIFINDVFFSLNPELRKKVLKHIASKDYQLQLYKKFKKEEFINLRIARVFYNAKMYEKSYGYFKTIDKQEALNQTLYDEYDVYLKNEFKHEYELMKYRFNRSISGIPWSELTSRDEILSEIIVNLYNQEKYQEAINYSDLFINWRRVDNFTRFLAEKFPRGLFYGVLSTIKIKDIQKAKKYSRFLISERPSRFLGYLSLSYCNHGEEQIKYFNMAVDELINKRHLFYKKNYLLMLIYFKPDWIKTDGIPIGILNNMEYFPYFIEKWLSIYWGLK